jgi:signal transduction histidine kinase
LAGHLKRRNDDLARAARDLDQFAYVASHDLKAPLRGVVNLSEWIEEDLGDDLPQDVKENVDLLRGRVKRMEALIDGQLRYSRAGRSRGDNVRVQIKALVTEVVDFVAPTRDLQFSLVSTLDALEGDPLPLRQVLQNLIANASQHAESKVDVRCSESDEEGWAKFEVSDDGPGIPEEHRDRVFVIFQTLEARDDGGGTGIGLAIVKKLVEDQGGRVWVESEPDRGAAFHFTWPAAPGATPSNDGARE